MRAMIRSTLPVAFALAAAACSGTERHPQAAVETTTRRQMMRPETDTHVRPAIDLEAPAAFQTATFALG
jgi:hypothetical protein